MTLKRSLYRKCLMVLMAFAALCGGCVALGLSFDVVKHAFQAALVIGGCILVLLDQTISSFLREALRGAGWDESESQKDKEQKIQLAKRMVDLAETMVFEKAVLAMVGAGAIVVMVFVYAVEAEGSGGLLDGAARIAAGSFGSAVLVASLMSLLTQFISIELHRARIETARIRIRRASISLAEPVKGRERDRGNGVVQQLFPNEEAPHQAESQE